MRRALNLLSISRCLLYSALAVGLGVPVVAAEGGSAHVEVEVTGGGSGTFSFSGTPAGELTVAPTRPDRLSATTLAPGAYTSTLVSIPPNLRQQGYALVEITCDDGDSTIPSTGNIPGATANFEIEPSESVTCRFVISKSLDETGEGGSGGGSGGGGSGGGGSGGGGVSPPCPSYNPADHKVVLLGLSDDREQWPPEFRQNLATACEIAKAYQTAAEMTLPGASQKLESYGIAVRDILTRSGAPITSEAEALAAIDQGVEEICNPEGPDAFAGPFTITFATCMMRMDTVGNVLAIRLPPNESQAMMEISSLAEQQAMLVNLNRDIGATAEVTGKGESTNITMSPTGATKEILGNPSQQYNFEYTASFSGAGGALEDILSFAGNPSGPDAQAVEMKVTNRGTVWAAPDACGADIVSAFYNNFATEIEAGQGMGTFFSGMIRSLAGMVQYGIPLETDQTISAPMGMKSTSQSRIVGGPYVLPLEDNLCGSSTIPEGFTVQKLSAEEGECDCTCEGFTRFQAESEAKKKARKKMSKKERKAAEKNDPANMCMVTCMKQWMKCAMQGAG